MAADSVSYDSRRGGTAVPAYLNTLPPLPLSSHPSSPPLSLLVFGLYLHQCVGTSDNNK